MAVETPSSVSARKRKKKEEKKIGCIHLLLLRRRQRRPIHTLRNRLTKQPRPLIRHKMQLRRTAPRTLSVNRHLPRVAAKALDIRLNPLERLDLVEEARVEGPVGGVLQGGGGEEAEGGEAVVDGDGDDVGALVDPVVEGPVCGVSVYVA